eukprot:TRINITY_DN123_c0_g1_i2.p2 TRINITY_DN123_c0_g1~~TRINITY_DN123_c0_g1_i2.p2  ORF type:complete len:263 (-),score=78.15 TRINITY_DN123_c0_g1_i2:37-825(-)
MDPFNFGLSQDSTSRLRESAQQLFNSPDPFNVKHDSIPEKSASNHSSISLNNQQNQNQFRNQPIHQQSPVYLLPYPQQQTGRGNQQPAFFYGSSPYPSFAYSDVQNLQNMQNIQALKGPNGAPIFISPNAPFNFQSINSNTRQENSDSNPNSPFASDEEQNSIVPMQKKEATVVQSKPRPAARTRGGRIQWTPELHAVFEECVEALGVAATAKNVMTLMVARGADVSNLTRVKVANHLQYYNSRKNKNIISKLTDKSTEVTG